MLAKNVKSNTHKHNVPPLHTFKISNGYVHKIKIRGNPEK